jgi:hypothetical protein
MHREEEPPRSLALWVSMTRELLESVELQRVSRVVTFERDDGSERLELGFSELPIPGLVATRERRLQLTKATTTMTDAILDCPDAGAASTPATELLVRRSICYKEVAEVFVTISQGSPPVVT